VTEAPVPPQKHVSRYDPLTWDAVRVITVGVLVCVVLAVSGLVVYLSTSAASDRRVKECLQIQVAELQQSYIAGREAARQDRQAQRELLLAQLSNPTREAVERFLQRLDDSDRARTANPPPSRNCL
jgi:type VI protein secretion system component VasK